MQLTLDITTSSQESRSDLVKYFYGTLLKRTIALYNQLSPVTRDYDQRTKQKAKVRCSDVSNNTPSYRFRIECLGRWRGVKNLDKKTRAIMTMFGKDLHERQDTRTIVAYNWLRLVTGMRNIEPAKCG